MKVLIAVPTYENILPDTFKSIYDLKTGDIKCSFDYIRGYDCATARNRIAQESVDREVDYVFMVDNDITLLPDALENLMEGSKDVCLGYYAHRNSQNVFDGKTSVCRPGEYNYTWQYPALELNDLRERGEYKIPIHGGGMGCALIRTEIFKKLEYPWFKWVNYESREVLSEDLYFCEQCNKNGIEIYADTRVRCGHLFRRNQWV